MKKFILIIAVMAASYCAMAQTKTAPDKETTVIYLQTSGESEKLFGNFGAFLMDNGFQIDRSDPGFSTIVTTPKNLAAHPKWSHSWFMNIRIKNNRVTIRPYLLANIEIELYGVRSSNAPIEWKYAKNEGNVQNMIYQEIRCLLMKFPDSIVTFN